MRFETHFVSRGGSRLPCTATPTPWASTCGALLGIFPSLHCSYPENVGGVGLQKATESDDIPANLLQMHADILALSLTVLFYGF